MDLKRTYYYIICLVSLFILFWGVVDLSGAAVGLSMAKTAAVSLSQSPTIGEEQTLDVYYQKKMLFDRLSDSLARIVVAGLVFFYCRKKVEQI